MKYTAAEEQRLAQMYADWKKGDDERDQDLSPTDPALERFNDLSYGPYGDYNLLDITLPKPHSGKLPVIINLHGGGFFYGTKETYQFYCMFLAKQGFAVVNFNYRLAPKFDFPMNLDDVDKVFTFLDENAPKYDLDLDHVFLVGDSAGGCMVYQVNTWLTNDEYRQAFGFSQHRLHVLAVAANCGGSFTNYWQDAPKELQLMSYFFADHQDHAKRDLTKFEQYVTKDFLPTYLLTANQDFLRNGVLEMDQFLTQKGIQHELRDYGSDQDPRGHVFHINQKDDLAAAANLDEIRFFKEFL